MPRLFTAIDIPEDVRDALLGLQENLPGARWVPADNYHLTLAFLGEIDRAAADDADAALAEVSVPAFDLALAGIGTFGDGHRARTLWVGVDEPSGLLIRLQGKVETALRRAGIALERRKFSPHVTLARLKQPDPSAIGGYMQRHNLFRSRRFTVDSFALIESHLRADGPEYLPLIDYPLTTSTAAD